MSLSENKNISRRKKTRAFLFALFFVLSFGFFNNIAHAGFCYCIVRDSYSWSFDEKQALANKTKYSDVTDSGSCLKKCGEAASQENKGKTAYYFANSETDSKINSSMNYTQVTNGYCYCAKKVGDNSDGKPLVDVKNNKEYDFVGSGDDCSKTCYDISNKSVKCDYYYFFSKTQDSTNGSQASNYECSKGYGTVDALNDGATLNATNGVATQAQLKSTQSAANDLCGGNLLEKIINPAEAFKCLLYGVLQVFGWLLGVAAVLFGWIVNPDNVSGAQTGLLNHHAIKDVWFMVRDTLNMTFIMVLLFAAFCTVFQVDSWNLKKVWLNILINSLLVNFSFPIARLFIDISNVAMYYFLNNLFAGQVGGGSNIMATFGNFSGISGLLIPDDYASASIAYLIAAIVVTFILATTMMVLAVLFLIRLIWLAVLLMFSPVGFVGYIFPETKHFASDWWNELFKNAFFGPIMVFMMMVAINMMKAFPSETIRAVSVQNTPAGMDNAWIGGAAFYAVPIAILWMSMGIAQKLGIQGAKTVVGRGQAFAKWAGKSLWHSTYIPGTFKNVKEDFSKKGKLFGKKIPFMGSETREKREARLAAGIIGGKEKYESTKRDQIRSDVNEMREKWKKAGGASSAEIDKALTGNAAARMAAALEMAEKNGFQNLLQYQNAKKAVANDKVFEANFDDKVKEKHIRFVIENEISTNPAKPATDVYKEHLDKLTVAKLIGQKGLFDKQEVANYLRTKQTSGNKNDRRFVFNVANGISNQDRLDLRNNGLVI